jgi:hypothetical protein
VTSAAAASLTQAAQCVDHTSSLGSTSSRLKGASIHEAAIGTPHARSACHHPQCSALLATYIFIAPALPRRATARRRAAPCCSCARRGRRNRPAAVLARLHLGDERRFVLAESIDVDVVPAAAKPGGPAERVAFCLHAQLGVARHYLALAAVSLSSVSRAGHVTATLSTSLPNPRNPLSHTADTPARGSLSMAALASATASTCTRI